MRNHQTNRQGGFIAIIVGVAIVAISLAAGIGAAVINHADTRHTVNVLTDPDAKSSDIESITDQQITNARNELPNSAALATNIAGLGGAPLGDGHTAAEVAGSAITQVAVGTVEPAVIDYMSDPGSKWNSNGGQDRPTEGTTPTRGMLVCGP